MLQQIPHLQVSMFVSEVLDGVGDYDEAHVGKVGGGHFEDSFWKSLPVFINVVDRHRAHDGALVACQGLRRHWNDHQWNLANVCND